MKNYAHISFVSNCKSLTDYRYCPNCRLHGVKVKDRKCNSA